MKEYHIKPYLKSRGFNLSALAKSMNMSFQRFDHYIKSRKDLSYNFLSELSQKLDMPLDELVTSISDNPKSSL